VKTSDLLQVLKPETYPERFRLIMPFIFEWENVVNKAGKILVENDPDDRGGETFCGLDRRSHPKLEFSTATPRIICDTYLTDYWLKYICEKYPLPLGEVVFNCVINAGWGRAAKIMSNGGKTAETFLEAQESFYKRLAAARPKSRKYLNGWLNRLEALAKELNIKFDRKG
jgi:hypothetical protein